MDALELERYLHDRIPLSRAMAVEVRAATPAGVVLYAPLAPNINHRDTVFGGSASALAILAAWSALLVRLKDATLDGRIVIQRNTTHYERPMAAAFTANASLPDGAPWERLLAAIRRGRPGRIRIHSVLECGGTPCGDLEGEFVVLPPERAPASVGEP
jgi:thioesterase domain-containing protein